MLFVYPRVHTSLLLHTTTLSVTVPALLDTTFYYYWNYDAIGAENTSDGGCDAAAQSQPLKLGRGAVIV